MKPDVPPPTTLVAPTPPDSVWLNALTLAERAALLDGDAPLPQAGDPSAGAPTRGVQQWREQAPFDDDALFVRRLRYDGLDADRLHALLATPVAALATRLPDAPDWLAELCAAYADPAPPVPEPGEGEFGFLEIVQPLVDRALARLAACVDDLVAAHPALPFDPATVEEVLLADLPDPLLMRLGRTLVLELNVARVLEQLDGDSAEARFHSFIRRLQDPDHALTILADYPVLARQLVLCIGQWQDVHAEYLQRLCADWSEICLRFSPHQDPGPLVDLTGGAGDTHRGGRSVMIAEFESGLRLVYKPKSLAVDLHFQELLAWLNERGCDPPLRSMTVFDRGDYGWVEFVEHRSCDTPAQVRRYYRRLGAYLALLYSINASDFHLENLIAHVDHPFLIDLETLFNPEFERLDLPEAAAQAARTMLDSVLVVGMLPQRLWSDEEYGGLDISGLAGEEGQLTPDRIPMPAEEGTDAMRYVRERTELEAEANRPMLHDEVTSAVDYVDDFLAGFRAMYRLLASHRDALLADDGPLARFAHDETRVLLRPTRTYDQLLFESFHPDMLQDGLERDRHWDRLWIVAPDRAFMEDVIPVEQADLRRGDIPVFTARPSSLDLFGAFGERITDVLTETGMNVTRRRMAQLSDADLRRQEWIIRCTLATVAPTGRGFDRPVAARMPRPTMATPGQDDVRTRLLACARAAAERVATGAILGTEDVAWLGLTPLPEEYWDLTPLDMDLYGGVAGVTLFLAYAGVELRDARYTALARRGRTALLRHVALLGEEQPGIGGFVGWGGALYTLTHLAALWRDANLLAQAEDVVAAIARFVADDDAFGVVYGAAGAIGALLAYHGRAGSDAAMRAAVACGEHLLAAAQAQDTGLAWVGADYAPAALTGFAHGAAGIGWALLNLAAATGDNRFRDAGQQAFAYERSVFDAATTAQWPDLRAPLPSRSVPDDAQPPVTELPPLSPPVDVPPMTAWCHGAVGIGLARLATRRHLADPHLQPEIDAALAAVLTHGFGRDHSLCHGDLGALELLLQAQPAPGSALHRAYAGRVAALLDELEADRWRCGGPEAVEMPSLMLGLSGMGYQLLRLADPIRVPALLLMEGP